MKHRFYKIYLYFPKIYRYIIFQDPTFNGEHTSEVCTATVLVLFDTKLEIMKMEWTSVA
jgi:hypothetical protein